jgi:hypothetical protein
VNGITSTRLGERTCVVSVPVALDAGAARRLEEGVNVAMADGYRDFVLDFTAAAAAATAARRRRSRASRTASSPMAATSSSPRATSTC